MGFWLWIDKGDSSTDKQVNLLMQNLKSNEKNENDNANTKAISELGVVKWIRNEERGNNVTLSCKKGSMESFQDLWAMNECMNGKNECDERKMSE